MLNLVYAKTKPMKCILVILALLYYSAACAQVQNVADVYPGSEGSAPKAMMVYKGRLLFMGSRPGGYPVQHVNLYAYKGPGKGDPDSIANTYYGVNDITPVILNNMLYFIGAPDLSTPGELMKWNGTNAPVLEKDIVPGNVTCSPKHLTVLGNSIFFSGNDGSGNVSLWEYNTTNGNAQAVSNGYKEIDAIVVYGGTIYFSGGPLGQTDLYRYSGGTATKIPVPGSSTAGAPHGFTELGGKLYFTAADALYGRELYSFDGSNLVRLTDVAPGNINGIKRALDGRPLGLYKGDIYFPGSKDGSDYSLFKFNPATKQVGQVDIASKTPYGFQDYHGTLYYHASEVYVSVGSTAAFLHSYDGSKAKMVDAATETMGDITLFDENIYFMERSGNQGFEPGYYNDAFAGIANVNLINDVHLYPNPAKEKMQLDVSLQETISLSVMLTDITGKIVYSGNERTYNAGKNKLSIDVSALPAGTYTCTLAGDKGMVWSGKVVVEQ